VACVLTVINVNFTGGGYGLSYGGAIYHDDDTVVCVSSFTWNKGPPLGCFF
jgi:hypothetical protein